MEKVSVVIPMHNSEKFIERTIFSALKQTYQNLEIIVIDDNSSDGCVEMVKKIADDRIFVYENKTNKGSAYCRNYGIEKATGTYIAFLDSDDVWLVDKIEKQVLFMETRNIDFSFTQYYDYGDEIKLISGPRVVGKFRMNFTNYLGTLTVMYNRKKLGKVSIPNSIAKSTDYPLWRAIGRKSKAHILLEPLGIYYRHPGSLSKVNTFQKIKNVAYGYQELEKRNKLSSLFGGFVFAVGIFLKKMVYRKKTDFRTNIFD
ncbi:MAG: glycosyltransferase family 2 protein [Bacilli bacterium]|nr:glycosyltransferase family 2 protein [Bacilli bacterium]